MSQAPKKPRTSNVDADFNDAATPRKVRDRRRILKEQRREMNEQRRNSHEQPRQRRFMILIGSVIGVALLAILAGVLYDQVYIPGQPVARVGDAALSKKDRKSVV